jgi:hypothetical protein
MNAAQASELGFPRLPLWCRGREAPFLCGQARPKIARYPASTVLRFVSAAAFVIGVTTGFAACSGWSEQARQASLKAQQAELNAEQAEAAAYRARAAAEQAKIAADRAQKAVQDASREINRVAQHLEQMNQGSSD